MAPSSHEPEPVRVLFVCTGNICRSPAAQAVMNRLVAERTLQARIETDSAGTVDFQAGNPPHPLMQDIAARQGYVVDHVARQVRHQDFERFDYIVGLESDHVEYLHWVQPAGVFKAQVSLLLDHLPRTHRHRGCDVPDPYLGSAAAFERALAMIEEGVGELLDEIVTRHGL